MADEDLGSAARALAEAVAGLTKAVGLGLTEAGQEVGAQLATSLREASRELAEASAEVGRRAGDQRRKAKADRTRAQLLAAARTVFARQGYEGASVGDIAAEAGFTKGALYANFAGKEELLLAIVEQLSAEEVAWFDEQRGRSPQEVFACASEGGEVAQRTLLMLEVFTYAVRHPEAREQIGALLRTSVQRSAQLLHHARTGQDGEPGDFDRDTALGILAVRNYLQVLGPLVDAPATDAFAAGTDATAQRLSLRLLADPPPDA